MKLHKVLLISLCLIAALALTACHTETDPWLTVGPTPTPVANGDTPTVEIIVQGEPTMLPTVEMIVQQSPTETPYVEETAQPGGDEEPGLNG